jgi:D-alanine-D-alanine ligase
VLEALDPGRYETTSIEIGQDGRWQLADGRLGLPAEPETATETLPVVADSAPARALGDIDVVVPILHGPFGEDGTVQGLCEIAGVAYVGAGVGASAIAMDKSLFKSVARAHDIPVIDSITVTARRWADATGEVRDEVASTLGYPVFTKPARLGSSVGISKVAGPEELDPALTLALRHDPKVLVERAMVGREVEVGVLGNDELELSPVGEIGYDSDWYDYDTKYLPDRMRLTVPADLPVETSDRLREIARRAFVATGCAGMARIDFFVDGGDARVLEVNTIPGFTPTSVYAKLFEAAGIGYRELVERLVALGLDAAAERARYLG